MEDSINRLLKNYLNARKSWEVWYYMNASGEFDPHTGQFIYSTSVRKKVDENQLLYYLRYLAFKDYHIEIYKILKDSPNNKDNVFSLLNKCLNEKPDLGTDIRACLKMLNDLNSEIKNIINIRDKFYAHLDAEYEKHIKNGSELAKYNAILVVIETAIILLTSKDVFQKVLDEIPSRYDYSLG